MRLMRPARPQNLARKRVAFACDSGEFIHSRQGLSTQSSLQPFRRTRQPLQLIFISWIDWLTLFKRELQKISVGYAEESRSDSGVFIFNNVRPIMEYFILGHTSKFFLLFYIRVEDDKLASKICKFGLYSLKLMD